MIHILTLIKIFLLVPCVVQCPPKTKTPKSKQSRSWKKAEPKAAPAAVLSPGADEAAAEAAPKAAPGVPAAEETEGSEDREGEPAVTPPVGAPSAGVVLKGELVDDPSGNKSTVGAAPSNEDDEELEFDSAEIYQESDLSYDQSAGAPSGREPSADDSSEEALEKPLTVLPAAGGAEGSETRDSGGAAQRGTPVRARESAKLERTPKAGPATGGTRGAANSATPGVGSGGVTTQSKQFAFSPQGGMQWGFIVLGVFAGAFVYDYFMMYRLANTTKKKESDKKKHKTASTKQMSAKKRSKLRMRHYLTGGTIGACTTYVGILLYNNYSYFLDAKSTPPKT